MIDLLRKGMFLGLGLFEEGREKIETLVDDLIKTGELAKEKRAETIDKYVKKIKDQEKAISGKINSEIKKAIEKLGVPTKKDFERLSRQVEELKKKLDNK